MLEGGYSKSLKKHDCKAYAILKTNDVVIAIIFHDNLYVWDALKTFEYGKRGVGMYEV